MLLINISNQIGAGPRNISLNLIRAVGKTLNPEQITILATDDALVQEALAQSGVNYKTVPMFRNPLLKAFRFFYIQFLMMWSTSTQRCERVLAFGNFFLVGSAKRKAVLMHHPYLVDDELLAYLPGWPRFLERVKRSLFRWTLSRVDVVIVQSDYMREMFRQMYPRYGGGLVVIPNPISSNFMDALPLSADEKGAGLARKSKYSIIYASRFYPHKNHAFVIDLSRAFTHRKIPIEIVVTVDPEIPGAAEFLSMVEAEQLPIRNVGEVPQPELVRQYSEADAAIFPSRAETFGNPLVEALRFALPVIAPRKGYAFAVLGHSGVYYDEDDVEGCLTACEALFADSQGYAQACANAFSQGQIFPDVQEWCERMMAATGE